MSSRLAAVAVATSALLLTACGASSADLSAPESTASGPRLAADPDLLLDAAASAMGSVTSVEFTLDRTGAPVYVDQFESLVLDDLVGQFSVPTRAQALLTIEVDGNLRTQLGAVAIDDTVWLSNPVTGAFEPLPTGFDLDPSKFFDPTGGWQPLLANLGAVELVDADADGRYHLRGVAGADEVTEITVGLVRNQSVPVDLWLDPVTALVDEAEFVTQIGSESTTWHLALSRYGETFEIDPPEGVL